MNASRCLHRRAESVLRRPFNLRTQPARLALAQPPPTESTLNQPKAVLDSSRSGPAPDRVLHCVHRWGSNPSGRQKQDLYVKALRASQSIDELEEGKFKPRITKSPLAIRGSQGKPEVVKSRWPVVVQDSQGNPVRDAVFLVSQLRNEEKGTDVNVASHLLLDVLSNDVEAAIVISNDSDLSLPVRECRLRVPVGVVNPSSAWLAGDLQGSASDGVGDHWWYQLKRIDFTSCQMPDPVGTLAKPSNW